MPPVPFFGQFVFELRLDKLRCREIKTKIRSRIDEVFRHGEDADLRVQFSPLRVILTHRFELISNGLLLKLRNIMEHLK